MPCGRAGYGGADNGRTLQRILAVCSQPFIRSSKLSRGAATPGRSVGPRLTRASTRTAPTSAQA
eukprot:1099209-Pyramimonas_sp.AAC.1